jgi:EAL and modified HD-GYP domain-containing signal transduction protein
MLLERAYTLMPPDAVVIGVFRNVKPDDAVEQACEELVESGYTLAFDDFVWSSHYRQLLELASIVKVDVLYQSPAKLDELAQRLAPYDVRLLAERVETADVRATCAGLGYELFQGYYYTRPEMMVNRALKSDEMTIVHAMNVVRDQRTTDTDVEAVFSADLALSHKLLRMVNSMTRAGTAIESLRQAGQLTGRMELSRCLALMLVSSTAARGGMNREIVHLALQRGRMCELLAGPTRRETDSLFLSGLFSLLDTISGIPMPELLEVIAPEAALRDALASRSGPYAVALMLAEAYEQGAWATVAQLAQLLGMDAAQVGACYIESLAWTRDRLRSLATA